MRLDICYPDLNGMKSQNNSDFKFALYAVHYGLQNIFTMIC